MKPMLFDIAVGAVIAAVALAVLWLFSEYAMPHLSPAQSALVTDSER